MLFRAGHTDEAMIHLYYVLKIDPEDKEALDVLAKMELKGRTAPQSRPVPDGASQSQN
jgi:hypothetical protein